MSDRLERVRARLAAHDVQLLVVGPSPELRWLVGYHALPLERPTLLLVGADSEPVLVVPELERPRAETSGAAEVTRLVSYDETTDPFATALAQLGGVPDHVAVGDRMWSSFTLALQERLPTARWTPSSHVLRELREVKDPDEIAALHAAGAAIDAVHARVGDLLRVGRRERDVGADIAELILAEHDEVNFVIVASGPNGASPHHETGDRVLQEHDAVVVDIGGTRDGYCSDATRNYVLGPAPDGYAELHALLESAQREAVDAVAPGVAAQDVDAAARRVIEEAGHGEHFVHRTGHGIGVEEHEHPYIVAGNDEPLRPGMAFSVEPGIYLSGRYGARIEDIVVVTSDGADPCNTRPHSLVEVPA